jgi:hypothetical protein
MLLPILICLLLGVTVTAYGEFYRYTDKNGKTRYVDDMVKVPPEYRDQLTTYDEPLDHLSEEEKRELEEKENLEESLNTNVVISENNIIIPVNMTNKGKEIEVFLVLDTGASITMLHRDAALQLGITDTQKSTATVAGGEKITFDLAKLDAVKVGPFEKNDLLVGIVDYQGGQSPHNGLLGMNFLQHYEYVIDYENRMIRWRPGDLAP